ncbi:MAG: adenosylcobinamide-phosphate synthase CbiB [Deltaproteobacteria bacterium]|jgi:adenosylcobinamide-phosphate synthase|nr:adenosylcobinamide-phosphate synthase CbiB [Deltaproteobacteria bacterium]
MPPLLTSLAFLLDSWLGDPQSWPHPVRVIGKLIAQTEKFLRWILGRFFSESTRSLFIAGIFLYLVVVGLTGLSIYVILALTYSLFYPLWIISTIYLVYSSICLKDLLNHTARVEAFLTQGDLDSSRSALSWIVGRDTQTLDPPSIRRAEIETLAENFSDGLIAPFFYLALGGPIFTWIYKATNTLDSMVGYKNDKYLYFGRFSAKADDVLNFIPARLAALFLIAGSLILHKNSRNAFSLWRKEAHFHTSPNSGQTEAAMAGALEVYLGGTSSYQGILTPKPIIGEGGKEANAQDVKDAESLVRVGTFLALFLVIASQALILTYGVPWGWSF